MTDSAADPDSDAAAPTSAMESLRAAAETLKHAQAADQHAMELWDVANEMGDPKAIERPKVELDHTGRGVMAAFRVMSIAQATFDRSIQDVHAEAVALLMQQAEAGAEQRAIAAGELMQQAGPVLNGGRSPLVSSCRLPTRRAPP